MDGRRGLELELAAARINRTLRHREGINLIADGSPGIPVQQRPAAADTRTAQSHLTGYALKNSADINGFASYGQGANLVVRARIPISGEARYKIDCAQIVAGLSRERTEAPSDVKSST